MWRGGQHKALFLPETEDSALLHFNASGFLAWAGAQ